MNRNVKVAKELVKLARNLVGSKFTDGLGEDSDNTNEQYDAQYEQIVRELYPHNVASTIIMSGHGLDYHLPVKGTMGNGNLILKYYADPRRKLLIIQALVSQKHKIQPSDTRDLINLYKFLKKQVEDGYTIVTDCNEHSITFLATFAKKNHYYFHAGESHNMFGETGDSRDRSRECICCKNAPRNHENDDNADAFSRNRPNLDRLIDEKR